MTEHICLTVNNKNIKHYMETHTFIDVHIFIYVHTHVPMTCTKHLNN